MHNDLEIRLAAQAVEEGRVKRQGDEILFDGAPVGFYAPLFEAIIALEPQQHPSRWDSA